jgi:hypothetical protein
MKRSGFPGTERVFVDLIGPHSLESTHFEPVSLTIFSSCDRIEMIESLLLGDQSNQVIVHRMNETSVCVGITSLIFRSKLECDIWQTLMNDILSATAIRYDQLLSGSKGNVPTGYRRHMQMLMDESKRLVAKDFDSESFHGKLLAKSLKCMQYLTHRLSSCRCSAHMDPQIEDTVYKLMTELSKHTRHSYI